MRKVTTAILALGMTVGLSSAAFACGFGKTASDMQHQTVAEKQVKSEEAMTTFDPAALDQLVDEKTEKTEDVRTEEEAVE